MPVSPLVFLFLFLVALFPGATSAADGVWNEAGKRGGVQVWKRKVEGSRFVEFKAETTVNSTLSALLNLFYDLDYAPKWLDGTRKVTAVKRDAARQEYVLLLETDMPWPLQDRDAVIAGRWWQDPGTLTVFMRGRSVAGVVPENPVYVRNNIRSDWTFIPLGQGRVRVVMSGHVDPGGNLPDWAVNMLIQESPLRTLGSLRRVIGDAARQAGKHSGVTEPSAGNGPATVSQSPAAGMADLSR